MASNEAYNPQASNQPYQRVDSGIGVGAVAGSSIALASAAATDFGMSRFRQTRETGRTMSNENGNINIDSKALRKLSPEDRKAMGIDTMAPVEKRTVMGNTRGMLFGNSRLGKVARYAGYGLAGGGIGAVAGMYSE
ncbi:MAG: hypothetical protein IJ880_03915 [Bacilli bacterium]|nr:hypothetical protein [Bacilli bacterium]